MLEIKVRVSDVDYDKLADILLPLLATELAEKGGLWGLAGRNPKTAGKIAHRFVRKKGNDGMETVVEKLAAKNKTSMMQKVISLAEKKQIRFHLVDISVEKIS